MQQFGNISQRALLAVVFLFLSFQLFGQDAERRLIIEDGTFYYVTTHPETMIGTLFTGKLNEPLDQAMPKAIPLGTCLRDDHNPLAWDLRNHILFGLNFMDNPLNDLMEALKAIPCASLEAWRDDEDHSREVIHNAALNNSLTPLTPYEQMLNESNVMQGFYYDVITTSDSMLVLAMANQDHIRLWQYDGSIWSRGERINHPIRSAFTLFEGQDGVSIIFGNGIVMGTKDLNFDLKSEKSLNLQLNDYILLDNRDEGTCRLVPRKEIDPMAHVHVDMAGLLKQVATEPINK